MSFSQRQKMDFLFRVQILGATLFCGAYAYRSFHDVTGSSLVQFSLVTTYLFFHLALAIGAHRAQPTRVTKQLIISFAWWIAGMCTILIAAYTNPNYRWTEPETAQLQTAIALTISILLIVRIGKLHFSDPMVKAFFAIAYKSVPQVLLAWKFLAEGGSGTPLIVIIVGHATILIRLAMIYEEVREVRWNRDRIWLAISETANELSWGVATIAWVIVL